MEKENKISLSISAEDMQAIQGAIQTLQDKLLPLLVQLDKDERKELNPMGDKSVAFVTKAYEYATQNPELVPNYMDVPEMKKDMDAVTLLRQIGNPLWQLAQYLDDTQMVAGSEAMTEALVFYNAVKNATKLKIGASQQIYDDLKQRFPGRPKKKE
jgi:hypothetical protein